MAAVQSERLLQTIQRIYHNIPSYRSKMQEIGMLPGDIKSVTVFLENKSGRLNDVTKTLGEAGVNISTFTIADTSDFGILRMIVSDPDKACETLKQNAFSVQTTDVVLAKTPNKPGSLSKLLEILQQEEVFIEYMYAFSVKDEGAVTVIRPTNVERSMEMLQKHKTQVLGSNELYQL